VFTTGRGVLCLLAIKNLNGITMKNIKYLFIIIITFYCIQAQNPKKAELEVLVNGIIADTLTWQNNNYTIRLKYFGKDSLDHADVIVKTKNKNDLDTFLLNNTGWDGSKWVFTGPAHFEITIMDPIHGNDTTEADFTDSINLKWTHPKNTHKTAYDTVVVSTPPNKIDIHNKAGTPTVASKYATSPDQTIVTAGDLIPLYAKVFMATRWLSEYETDPALSNLITWSFVDVAINQADTSLGNFSTTNGSHSTFYFKKGGKYVDITATIKLSGLPEINETIRFYSLSNCIPVYLSIEASKDSTISPFDPAPWDPIYIYGNGDTKTVYAILRDKEGNWISGAENTIWSCDSSAFITVTPGPSDSAIIRGTGQGIDTVTVYATYDTVKCSTSVIYFGPYIPPRIRIVQINGTVASDIEQLKLNLSEDTTLLALGKRADDSIWLHIPVKWNIEPLLTGTSPPVDFSWNISPERPGKGIIYIQMGTATDTVFFEFGESSIVNYLPLNQQKIKIQQYKNSQGTSIQIHFNNPVKEIEASLISIDGRLIAQCKEGNTQNIVLNTKNKANGMYLLQLKSGDEIFIGKLCLIH
jgi:hypothetical protein